MKAVRHSILQATAVGVLFTAGLFAQAAGEQQPEFIKRGQQLLHEGRLEEALSLYDQTLKATPDSLPALLAAGSVLDLIGRGVDARNFFQKAIHFAATPEIQARAQRAMSISYAFEADCAKTIEYEQKVFDYYASIKNFYQQGEIADEAARVCLDSVDFDHESAAGDLERAIYWYQLGHDTGLKEPDIKPARVDLWNFRWAHAQARIAARKGNQAAARKHVNDAKLILDKGAIPEQVPFFPYLEGYVAFFGKDYKVALEQLLKANQNDPFVQCLLGRTFEALDESDKAAEHYSKAAAATAHNPPAAYAVPWAKKRLTSLRK